MPLRPGEKFGPFQIVDHLGRGGMGTVFRAFEPNPGRHVALKALPAEYLHDESFAERFRREATFIANLEHPNIVPLYEVGIDEGVPWMAMRLVAGGALASQIKKGRLPFERAVAILAGMAAALDYAHQRKIVHRDVKPHNVLLDESGHVYLSDFGLARILEGASLLQGALSLTHGIVGTPHYMAPEQVGGKGVDHRCDIYALGIVAYELFTGRVPFSADTPIHVLMMHASETVPMPDPSDVPPALIEPVVRALAKAPADRWPSAGAFVRALEKALAAGAPPLTQSLDAPSPRPAPTPPPATPRPDDVPTAPPPRKTRPAPAAPPPRQAPKRPEARPPAPPPPPDGSSPPPRSRGPLVAIAIGGALALALAVAVATLWLVGRTKPEPPPQTAAVSPAPAATPLPSPASQATALEVRSSVTGAIVSIDGRRAGTAPVTAAVVPGRHVVEVAKQGCAPTQVRVEVAAGTTLPIEAEPSCPSPTPEPSAPVRVAANPPVTQATPTPAPTPEPTPVPTPVPTPTPLPARRAGDVWTNPRDGLEYVWIPPGTFQMGCVPGDGECDADEKPRHPVTLTRGFWIGRTEVTVAAYRRLASPPGSQGGEDHPVVNVSWNDANGFCDSSGGRLPTEAEWEYAARGGRDGLKYPWGDSLTHDQANYSGTGGTDRWDRIAPVASFPATGFGLFDMSGNVWEWVADWFAPYASSTATDPRGPGSGSQRVVRGGSWNLSPGYLRVSVRLGLGPEYRNDSVGFRCSRDGQ